MSAHDAIPAVREEEATGETAEVFADLRETLGLPFVNLIWRHLATVPGALGWTWRLVRPVYLSAALDEQAARLRARPRPAGRHALPAYAWDAAGIGPEDRRAIAALIDGYNRGNSQNLLGLLVARSVLRGEPVPAVAPRERRALASAGPGAPPPRLLGLDEVAPPVLALVRGLDGFGRLGRNAAVASLFRHLAHWPAFLALAYAALLPQHLDGALGREQEALLEAARSAASGLAGLVDREVAASRPDGHAAALAALDEFTALMIGRMNVMGPALAQLLPAGPEG